MDRLKPVALSIVLTSAFWLAVGGWWSMRHTPAEGPASGDEGRAGEAARPYPATSGVPLVPDGAPAPGSVDSHLLIPVAGVRPDDLVDTFARSHGIDIPAPPGMPVIAAAPGIVEKLSASSGGGSIYVRSPDRTRLYHYAGVQAYAAGVSEAQVIGAGDQLGSIGPAGSAGGKAPHLHFEVLAIMPDRDWSGDKRPINPYPLLGGRENQSR